MIKVRINREYATLVRYCEFNRDAEWVCVKPKYEKYHANCWEIWTSIKSWRKRQKWTLVTICGSWSMMSDKWEYHTGQKISY